jgi:hypothetical protein
LDVDANGPKGSEANVEGQADDGIKDVEQPAGDFDEVEEHADNANVEVVICVTVTLHVSLSSCLS